MNAIAEKLEKTVSILNKVIDFKGWSKTTIIILRNLCDDELYRRELNDPIEQALQDKLDAEPDHFPLPPLSDEQVADYAKQEEFNQ